VPAPSPFAEVAARVRNWGRWGTSDEIGTLNLIDDAARRRAARSIVSGRAFTLGLRLSEDEGIQAGFVPGRVNPSLTMIKVNEPEGPDPDFVRFSEDVLRSRPKAPRTGTPWRTAATPASSTTATRRRRCPTPERRGAASTSPGRC